MENEYPLGANLDTTECIHELDVYTGHLFHEMEQYAQAPDDQHYRRITVAKALVERYFQQSIYSIADPSNDDFSNKERLQQIIQLEKQQLVDREQTFRRVTSYPYTNKTFFKADVVENDNLDEYFGYAPNPSLLNMYLGEHARLLNHDLAQFTAFYNSEPSLLDRVIARPRITIAAAALGVLAGAAITSRLKGAGTARQTL